MDFKEDSTSEDPTMFAISAFWKKLSTKTVPISEIDINMRVAMISETPLFLHDMQCER